MVYCNNSIKFFVGIDWIEKLDFTLAQMKKMISEPIMTKACEITRKNITGTDFGLNGL